MRKFIITSPNYTGEAHVIYGLDNSLITLDYSRAELTVNQAQLMKDAVPVVFYPQSFLESFQNLPVTVVEGTYELTFDMFWDKYDHKINRKRCEPLWEKLGKTKQVKAYHGITPYDNHLALNKWKTKANPETFLKEEYWETDWSKVK